MTTGAQHSPHSPHSPHDSVSFSPVAAEAMANKSSGKSLPNSSLSLQAESDITTTSSAACSPEQTQAQPFPTLHIDPIIEPDSATDEADDEAYATASTTTSFVTSLASSILRGVEENGRVYASYGLHKPWLPIDDAELDRNDLQHCKFTLLLDNQLFLAPIGDHPQKILDLGTGSGIWAIDVADKYPSAEVIGVDTAPTQPSMVPPNLAFEIDDIEHDWLWPADAFDFVHGRELVMAIHDWPRLVAQARRILKPGGYLQLCGSVPDFRSDDGTLPPDSAYVEIGQIYFRMSGKIGTSGLEPTNWKKYLLDAGFEDVVERVLKIPTNAWPRDPRQKKIGAFELEHFINGISNVFARGYTNILQGDPTYFQVLLARARREVVNRNMHSWVPFYVIYGRRPAT